MSVLLAPDLMARVRQIRIRTHRLVNTALSGGYRSTFRGSGLEFSDVRAYQPGDEVRRIDWNVTARTGEAFVKNYAEERELTINLIVDTSRSMDFGRAWSRCTKAEPGPPKRTGPGTWTQDLRAEWSRSRSRPA